MRERAVTGGGAIENLFQGANPGTGYPGDRDMRSPTAFTIQVHHLNLHRKDNTQFAADVRVIAVRVPEDFRRDGVYQPGT